MLTHLARRVHLGDAQILDQADRAGAVAHDYGECGITRDVALGGNHADHVAPGDGVANRHVAVRSRIDEDGFRHVERRGHAVRQHFAVFIDDVRHAIGVGGGIVRGHLERAVAVRITDGVRDFVRRVQHVDREIVVRGCAVHRAGDAKRRVRRFAEVHIAEVDRASVRRDVLAHFDRISAFGQFRAPVDLAVLDVGGIHGHAADRARALTFIQRQFVLRAGQSREPDRTVAVDGEVGEPHKVPKPRRKPDGVRARGRKQDGRAGCVAAHLRRRRGHAVGRGEGRIRGHRAGVGHDVRPIDA